MVAPRYWFHLLHCVADHEVADAHGSSYERCVQGMSVGVFVGVACIILMSWNSRDMLQYRISWALKFLVTANCAITKFFTGWDDRGGVVYSL